MKKQFLSMILILVLALSLMCISFTGCTPAPTPEDPTEAPTAPVEQPTEKPTEKPTEEPTIPSYTITVEESENGTVSVDKTEVKKGESVTITFTANDGCFLTNARVNGTNRIEEVVDGKLTITNIQENIVVMAIYGVQQYEVIFDTDGAGEIDSVVLEHGATVTKPEDPTKLNYIFDGWTLNGEAYDFAAPVTGNITLVATWHKDPTAQYLVKHYIAASGTATVDGILYATETLTSEYGKTTEAVAMNIPGFIPTEIAQITLVDGEDNIVNVFYIRDMLVDTLEHMPLGGDYSLVDYSSVYSGGYMGKVLMLNGEATPYAFSHLAHDIVIEYNETRGGKVVRFHKSGADKVAQIYITLTAQQQLGLQQGGSLTFVYWSNGGTLSINDYAIPAENVTSLGNGFNLFTMTDEMAVASGKSGKIHIKLDSAGFLDHQMMIDDITVVPGVGYTVEHKYGDTVMQSEFIKAEVGSTTKATAAEIAGFTAGTIEQATVAEGNTTVVSIHYTRDMLMDTLEHMPMEGYTHEQIGYQNTGLIMMLNGVDTGYRTNYGSVAVRITNDAHSGDKAIEFQKWGNDRHTTIEITLTAEMVEVINNYGALSFWYKTNGGASLQVNGVDVGGSGDWKQVQMDATMLAASASSGKIVLYLYDTWHMASVWVDDIVAVSSGSKWNRAELETTLEDMPVDGNYSLEDYNSVYGGGYMGKVLMLDGKATPYAFSHLAADISIEYNGTKGSNVVRFHKSGVDKVAQIYITLTAEQQAALKEGGSLSFAYWSNGGTLSINGYAIPAENVADLGNSFKKLTMTAEMVAASAESGKIHIKLDSAGFLDHQLSIDDIIVTPAD